MNAQNESKLPQAQVLIKIDSSEDIGRNELEEGKTGSLGDLITKSPNLQKKAMNFGHGNQPEYAWIIQKSDQNIFLSTGPQFFNKVKDHDIRIIKVVDKWDRVFILDKKGKVFQWEAKTELLQTEESKISQDYFKVLDAEVDGKLISKQNIKDICCTSNCLFMTTENGEVIVGRVTKGQDESASEYSQSDYDDMFAKRLSKLTYQNKINFSYSKLNSIQSHFISQIACGTNHVILLTQSGFVYSFGKNEIGQLGHPSSNEDIKEPTIIFQLLNLKVFSVSCGKHHNIVIGTARDTLTQTFQIYSSENALVTTIDKNKTLVYSWGYNKQGQLGLEDDQDRHVPTLVESVIDYNFKKVSCGYYHSSLLEESGLLFTFGNNEFGQIGNGSLINQKLPQPLFSIQQQQQELESEIQENLNNSLSYQQIQQINQPHIIITKFIQEVVCNRYTSICVSDENEIFIWGKDILNLNKGQNICEPQLLIKPEDGQLNMNQDENQIIDKPYLLKDFGLLFTSKQKQEKESDMSSSIYRGDGSSFQSMHGYHQEGLHRDYSSNFSNSFLRAADNQTPLSFNTPPQGISFSKEFENLLQYIAITAGNTNMPDGLKPLKFRPDNLPPKTQEEESQHQRLVAQNRKEYVKKLRERERQREKQKAEQIRRELRMQEMREIWEKEIFPNWDQLKRTKRVRELWIEGLPPIVRGKVWYYAFGNRSSISKDLYMIMAEKGCKLRKLLKELNQIEQEIVENGGQPHKSPSSINDKENGNYSNMTDDKKVSANNSTNQSTQKVVELNKRYDKLKKKLNFLINFDQSSNSTLTQSREKSISIIETDLPRTFPMLGLFKVGGTYYDQLQRILEAFTMHRPDIGYVQGMSYVAATLLIYMDEQSAFITFSNMITKYPIMPFFNFNEGQVKKILQLFKQVLQHNLPDLCEHLEMENIQPKQYVYEWFMTIFTRSLNLSLVSRVWDFYFLDGLFVLYQTAIAILRILEKHILEVDFEGIMKILKNISDYVNDEGELVQYIYDVSFPKWVYDEIPKLESEFLNQI